MTVLAIRTAIRTRMLTVANIGVVHAYERYANDMVALKALYFSAPHNQIRGWFIRPDSVRETGIAIPAYLEVATWSIRGVMSLSDATQSELVFSDLVEGLRDAFRADSQLGATVTKTGLLQAGADRGLQVDDYGPVSFAGVLCHGVRLRLTTTRERTQ